MNCSSDKNFTWPNRPINAYNDLSSQLKIPLLNVEHHIHPRYLLCLSQILYHPIHHLTYYLSSSIYQNTTSLYPAATSLARVLRFFTPAPTRKARMSPGSMPQTLPSWTSLDFRLSPIRISNTSLSHYCLSSPPHSPTRTSESATIPTTPSLSNSAARTSTPNAGCISICNSQSSLCTSVVLESHSWLSAHPSSAQQNSTWTPLLPQLNAS